MDELEATEHVDLWWTMEFLVLIDSFIIRLIRYSTRGEVFPRFLVLERVLKIENKRFILRVSVDWFDYLP
jgi:hypothetical protein